jgi:hypothetical protein
MSYGSLLRLRNIVYAIDNFPHAEERAKLASRSTHNADATQMALPRRLIRQMQRVGVFEQILVELAQIA